MAVVNPREFDILFAALAAPFDPQTEVKARTQAGKTMHYITARHVMNRLDDVLGPVNWWDDFLPSEHSVICKLSIRLPDGTILTKSDAGGYAGMADPGDDDKSGFADALKRAAVKFGVGRYLYRDGIPKFAREHLRNHVELEAQAAKARPEPQRNGSAQPARTESARDWIARQVHRFNRHWRQKLEQEGDEPADMVKLFEVVNHLANALIQAGLIKAGDVATEAKRDVRKALAEVERVWASDPTAIKVECGVYLKDKLAQCLQAFAEVEP